MMNEIVDIQIDDWYVKIKLPYKITDAPVTLLLHGWTGDEKSMWSFGKTIPEHHIVIAPRGLYPSMHESNGGYSWVGNSSNKWSWFKDFLPSVYRLNILISDLSKKYRFNAEKINLIGFSQGAACCYAYLATYTEQIKSVAGLAGFLPVNINSNGNKLDFSSIDAFVGHGSLDEIVPFEMADKTEIYLSEKGANVLRCNAEVKHKMSSDCLKKLTLYMNSL